MKKLTSFLFMVMLSLTVFCSNNETPANGQSANNLEKSTVENPADIKQVSNTLLQTQTSEQPAQLHDTCINIEDCAEGEKDADSIETNQNKSQCKNNYTEGISNVDFIEFVPDLRWWLA